jgi:UDP-3-O-[3-hydroxymyristoyl] glucosamine N-acyltransferase
MARTARPIALATLAEFLDCAVEGDRSATIHGFASLSRALEDDLIFLRDARHGDALRTSSAQAVLAPEGVDVGGRSVLRTPRPAHDFSRLLNEFAPASRPGPGIDSSALVDPEAQVDASASIAAGAVVGPGCRVGARTIIAANVTLTREVSVGEDCLIHAGAVLREQTLVGNRVVLQPGVVLGGDGFGLVADAAGRPAAMAQRGRVVIEDDVEIGANSTVDRATLDETRIRRGAKIDNLVQIAHNCDIGENALIVAQSGLAGGTVVGAGAMVMAQAGSAGHLRIGDGAFIGARAGLHRDVPAGARVFGAPQMEERAWHRVSAALKRLPELIRRVRRLEIALEDRAGGDMSSGGDSDKD